MNLYEHTIIARQDISPSQLKQIQEKYSKTYVFGVIPRGPISPFLGDGRLPRDTYEFIAFGDHHCKNYRDSYSICSHDHQML